MARLGQAARRPATAAARQWARRRGGTTRHARSALRVHPPQRAGGFPQRTATGLTSSQGTDVTVIALISTNGDHAVSFARMGATIPAGTYPIRAVLASGATPPTSFFQGRYVVLQANGDMHFLADSGSVTITSDGSAVKGEFVLFASSYELWERPASIQLGSKAHVLGQGTAPVKITGSFDAVRH
jgi:hypothetical protein